MALSGVADGCAGGALVTLYQHGARASAGFVVVQNAAMACDGSTGVFLWQLEACVEAAAKVEGHPHPPPTCYSLQIELLGLGGEPVGATVRTTEFKVRTKFHHAGISAEEAVATGIPSSRFDPHPTTGLLVLQRRGEAWTEKKAVAQVERYGGLAFVRYHARGTDASGADRAPKRPLV